MGWCWPPWGLLLHCQPCMGSGHKPIEQGRSPKAQLGRVMQWGSGASKLCMPLSSGWGLMAVGLRQAVQRDGLMEAQCGWCVGQQSNKLGREFHRWPCVYTGRQEWEMAPTSSFIPGGGPLGYLSLRTCSEISIITLPLVCHRHLSNCCFCAVALWTTCPLILLRAETQFPSTLLAFSEPSQLIFFLIPHFKSCWL